jgi:hypothetical protein
MNTLILILFIFIIVLIVFNIPYCYSLTRKEKIKVSNLKSDIIISLTSTPNRINTSENTLKSILNGTVAPKAILFNIPYISSKGQEYIIPEWLKKMVIEYPILKLNRCDRDYGPATKVIPAILAFKDDPDQKIVYIDDDIIYNRDFLKTFLKDISKYPDNTITRAGYDVSTFQRRIVKTKIWEYRYYIGIFIAILLAFFLFRILGIKNILILIALVLIVCILSSFIRVPRKKDIAMGFSDVYVKPSFFDIQKLVDYQKYPKGVFFQDDIYLSGHLRENGVQVLVVKDAKFNAPNFHEFVMEGLSQTANFSEKNRIEAIESFDWIMK